MTFVDSIASENNRLTEFLVNPENSLSQHSTRTSGHFWSRKTSLPEAIKPSEQVDIVKNIPKLLHLKAITSSSKAASRNASQNFPQHLPTDSIDDHLESLASTKKTSFSSPLSSRAMTQASFRSYLLSPKGVQPHTSRKNFAK